jgi:hypothetical protein
MHGPEMFAFFVLCVVLFIGQVFYKEAFSDCNSPGALTWTITMNPGPGATNTCSGGDSSNGSSSGGESSDSSGNISKASNHSSSPNTYEDEEEDDNYRRRRSQYYRYARRYDDDNYGYALPDMDDWWPDVSGSDVSGNSSTTPFYFNLSLTDLLSLVGKTIVYGGSQVYDPEQEYRSYRHRHRNSRYRYDDYEEYFNNNNTPASSQGIQYKRGINMDDYVRKDSIPCYACTL